jgi:phosphoglycerate dehydrogenase-like enzyme
VSNYRLVMLPPQTDATRTWADRVRHEVTGVDVVVAEDEAEARAVLSGAAAAFGTLPPALLPAADALAWLQAPAAAPPPGYFHPGLVEHPVQVTNFREIYNDHVAYHAVAMVLALARNLHTYVRQQQRHEYRSDYDPGSVLHLPESTALIVGVGGIGREIGRLLASFGVRVIGTDARASDAPGIEIHPPEALDTLLPTADVVVLTVPHTPETEGMMDRRRFGLMRSSAFLVNIGRGPTVRLDDLVGALRSGQIAGAGLDVFEVEPLPAAHALWDLPNVILTPHVAVTGPYLDERRGDVFVENARRFAAGDPLVNVVDKKRWF